MSGVDYCGCCQGISQETPAAIDNRPGLSEIAYRVGTWTQFKASMLDALSNLPQLAGLRTRDDDDFTIALCDAFAIVCDILTFYYERSANEHYLRTATQLVSVAELAALVGYEPSPGVAASAALAFTLESPPPVMPQTPPAPQPALVPNQVPIPLGTQVQSVPGPGEQPVTFETVAPITARYAWNALEPRQSIPYAADPANCHPTHLRLQGLIGTLQVGDYVLIVVTQDGNVTTGINRVSAVTQDLNSQTTLVVFEVAGTVSPVPRAKPGSATEPLSGMLSYATIENQVAGFTWSDQASFVAQAQKLQWDIDQTQQVINEISSQTPSTPPLQVFRLGIRASIFGHNAPYYNTLPSYTALTPNPFPDSWENETVAELSADLTPVIALSGEGVTFESFYGTTFGGASLGSIYGGSFIADPNNVYLDATYPALVVGTWVVMSQSGTPAIVAQITNASTTSVARFLLSSTVTVLTLKGSPDLSPFRMRTTAVLGSTDEYQVAEELLDNTMVSGATILLNSAQLRLQTGQEVIVSGTSATKTGQTSTELHTIVGLALVDGRTQLTLDAALADQYVWNSVTLNANVAPATQGTTRSQILGSGDATAPYQRFALNQLPVTYVSAATPSTIALTLQVRVNGRLWNEVPYFYGHGPAEWIYVTQVDTLGNRFVEFGDGAQNGARLPTGQNNVIAGYRQGLGSAGNVAANKLSTLLTRPLGVRSVVNPIAASGGGDPQTLADARTCAPITVRALDRIVSLDDFADFCAASAAVAKASAVWAWDEQRQVVCITVSGPQGVPILPESQTYLNLVAAIQAAGDGTVPIVLCTFVPRTFTVGATLTVDPSYDADVVTSAAKAALQSNFSFDQRAFLQPVYMSEVVALLQQVLGVVALTIDTFDFSDGLGVEFSGAAQGALVAGPPRLVAGALAGAELLTIDGGPLPGVVHA